MFLTLSNMIPTQGIGEHINIEVKDKYIFGNWIKWYVWGLSFGEQTYAL